MLLCCCPAFPAVHLCTADKVYSSCHAHQLCSLQECSNIDETHATHSCEHQMIGSCCPQIDVYLPSMVLTLNVFVSSGSTLSGNPLYLCCLSLLPHSGGISLLHIELPSLDCVKLQGGQLKFMRRHLASVKTSTPINSRSS